MKEDKHSIRVTFDHDNGMSLDLKSCGTLYLEPHKEYFFENAPIKFIDYLTQLKRLGVTYRLTKDKKGCYRTIDLTHYLDNSIGNVMSSFRHNYQPTNEVPQEIVRDIKGPITEALEADDELIPPVQNVQEVTLNTVPVINNDSVEPLLGQLSMDDITSENDEKQEDTNSNTQKTEEVIDIETVGKPKLIEYAHSLGLTEVSDTWTKKEIREEIKNKLAETNE